MSRLPPAEKLSLALRKNVRDEYEAKRAGWEKKMSEILGVAWTIDINPNAIWPYCKGSYGKDAIGSCIGSYVEGAIWQLGAFSDKYDEQGLAELNGICHAHVLNMDIDLEKKFAYSGCQVEQGRLVIMLNDDEIGSNVNDSLEMRQLLKALNDAPPAPGQTSNISVHARFGIAEDYDPKIEGVRKRIAAMTGNPDIKLNPNFDDTFAKLRQEEKRKKNGLSADWESRLGGSTRSYFEAVEWTMSCEKFAEDEMIREGFNETVDKGEITFRIVDTLSYDSYCEVVVENGLLYVQCLASSWDSNSGSAAQKLIDQL